MNYRMGEMTDCGSYLENESTAKILWEVRGRTIVAPFPLIFEVINAVEEAPSVVTPRPRRRRDSSKRRTGVGADRRRRQGLQTLLEEC
jgi:hypothetical protein